MKKIIVFLIAVLITGAISAQQENSFKYKINAKGGIIVTLKADTASKVDSMKIVNNKIGFYHGSTSKDPLITDTISGSTVYVKLTPDTVQHTDSYTIAASDWGKDQHVLKATSVAITIPENLNDWPVGGTLNFYGEGAGILVFKKGSNVQFISDKDSIATSRKGQAVTIKKIAANKYFLVGPLTD